jgi:6-phosphogluconate dehydrogenase (decarboxylating)
LTAALIEDPELSPNHTFAEKMLSGLRDKFGGHVERPAGGQTSGR